MDCREACERLPWYLNGTLEELEREDLRVHMDGCARCRQDLAETRRAAALFGPHVAPEVIVALSSGEAPSGPEAEQVRSHLAACADCAEELELAGEGLRAVADAPHAAPSAGAKRPRALGSLAAGAAATFAAGLLIGRLTSSPPSGGETGRVASLESEVVRLRQERAAALVPTQSVQKNVPVLELLPEEALKRGSSPASTQPPAPRLSGPFVAVSLVYDSPRPYEDYRLEVEDPEGTVLWRAEGLLRQPDGDFTALLPTAPLREGRHVLRLSGRRAETWTVLASYVLDVRGRP
jgi:hypothetical protein